MKRRTVQRVTIERVFAEARRPLGPQEILDAARPELPTLNLATVYRTLRRMVEEEAISTVELPGAPARYELAHVAEEHHHHFRCTACDAVFDLEGCVDGLKRMLPAGFQLTGHDILLIGLCDECAG